MAHPLVQIDYPHGALQNWRHSDSNVPDGHLRYASESVCQAGGLPDTSQYVPSTVGPTGAPMAPVVHDLDGGRASAHRLPSARPRK